MMPWQLAVGALLAAATPAGGAQPACGPAAAETLAASRHARVYAVGAQAVGCQRRSRPHRLGLRSRVLGVRLAGRFAGVRRAGLTGTGEQLSVYDLQHGRRIGAATYDGSRSGQGVGRFTRIRLARTGAAVYIVELADGGGRLVGDTSGELYADDTLGKLNPDPGRIDPATLGFAGSTVAWRTGDTFGLSQLDELSSRSGTLLRLGRVRVVAISSRYQDELRARIGGRPFVRLGEPMLVCLGSSGCGGVEALQRAGRYLATRYFSYSASEEYGWLTIHDLRSGRSRTLCRASSMSPSGRGSVAAFVLTRRGTAACAVSFEVPGAPRVHQIRAEGAVLDQGSGIELNSLRRRDDRLVWVHDGVEHTAPLP